MIFSHSSGLVSGEISELRTRPYRVTSSSTSNSLTDSNERRSLRPSDKMLLERGNSRCCDCRSPDPRWAPINLGITLCIECSGIHRSLGVHVSRVRSLALDDWDSPSIKILVQLGNDICDSVYESKEEAFTSKINVDSSRDAREKWIKAKYVNKKFVDLSAEYIDLASASEFHIDHKKEPSIQVCNELLHQAVQDSNFENILHALTLGADINSKFLGLTCLHHAVQTNMTELTEFLLLNGANINCTNAQGSTPLHLAVQAGIKRLVFIIYLLGIISLEFYLFFQSSCSAYPQASRFKDKRLART